LTRATLAAACAVWLFVAGARAAQHGSPNAPRPQASEAEGPAQPIAYSHRVHAGTLQLPCTLCHVNPAPGELMTLPATATCMTCHAGIKTESPAIQALAAHAKAGTAVPWVRVYQIASYVNFSHRTPSPPRPPAPTATVRSRRAIGCSARATSRWARA
jgi:hypothetical protein